MTRIYHITHMRNLPGILEHEGLHCDRSAQTLKSVQIGHQHIKARRMARVVPLPPNGTLGDYVPFYFASRSPMLYAIHKGLADGYDGGQEPVVYLVSSAEAVEKARLEWVFTEGHAEIAFSDFFDDLDDLEKIDWRVMASRYWFDTDEAPIGSGDVRRSSLFINSSRGNLCRLSVCMTVKSRNRFARC
jgi:hypothetical protein